MTATPRILLLDDGELNDIAATLPRLPKPAISSRPRQTGGVRKAEAGQSIFLSKRTNFRRIDLGYRSCDPVTNSY